MRHNRLLQLLADNQRRATVPGLRAEASATGLEIFVYDVIDPWFGVSAKAIGEAMRASPDAAVTLRINSPGGDAFEGRAIASLIRAHKGPTRAVVDGIAASAASTIAIAAGELAMAEGSFLMVHNAWTFALGNAADLEQTAKLLRKVDAELAADYAKRSGATLAQAEAWMAAETWFTAQEAVDAGLANAALTDPAAFAAFNLAAFDHAPQALVDRIAALMKPPANDEPTADQLRAAAARRLRLFEDRAA